MFNSLLMTSCSVVTINIFEMHLDIGVIIKNPVKCLVVYVSLLPEVWSTGIIVVRL